MRINPFGATKMAFQHQRGFHNLVYLKAPELVEKNSIQCFRRVTCLERSMVHHSSEPLVLELFVLQLSILQMNPTQV